MKMSEAFTSHSLNSLTACQAFCFSFTPKVNKIAVQGKSCSCLSGSLNLTKIDRCHVIMPCAGNPIQTCGCLQDDMKGVKPLVAHLKDDGYTPEYDSKQDLLANGIFLSGYYKTKDNNGSAKYLDLWETACLPGWKNYSDSCLNVTNDTMDFTSASDSGCKVGILYRNTPFGFWTKLTFNIDGDNIWGDTLDGNKCLTSKGPSVNCANKKKFACAIRSE